MADNKEDEIFWPARFSCEKLIYISIDSNHWKYWIFNVEIFTFLWGENEIWLKIKK